MKKRICAFLLSFAYLLTSFSIPVGAADDADNQGGYWFNEFTGIRCSLITPDNLDTPEFDGRTLKTIDIFDYSLSYNLDSRSSSGGIHNVLYGNEFEKSDWGNIQFEFRVLTQCKIDIARNANYDPNDFVSQEIPKYSTSETWSCADINEIFRSEATKKLFNPVIIDFDPNYGEKGRFSLATKTGADHNNRQYSFLNGWLKEALLDDGIKATDEFYGICDLLQALGLNIYTSENTSKRELYSNIISEFIIPNYAIVFEPVYVIPMRCWTSYKAESGTTMYDLPYSVVIYYGSATELSFICSHAFSSGREGLLDCEWWGYDRYGTKDGDAFYKNDLRMTAIVNGLSMKAAYLNEDYKEELLLYTGGSISYVEDCEWDFYNYDDYSLIPEEARSGKINWTPDNFKRVETIKNMFGGQCALSSTGTFYYSNTYTKNRACGMTMITSSDIVKPVIEAFDYEFPVDTEVVTSVEVSNKSLDESYLPSVDEVSTETVTNANGVPVSLVSEFVMSEIETTDENGITNSFVASVFDEATGQWKMTDEVKRRFYTEEGYDDSNPPAEDGAEPLPDIPAAYYATIDGLVSKGVSMENGYADAFASVNWTTPKHPCKVKFRVNFYNANYDIEPVLGTNEENSRNGQRETKISSDKGTGICYTDFECVINEKFRTTVSEIELPNPASITSVETASVISDPDERERYEQSVEARDNYFDEAETGDVLFDRYLNEITGGSQPSTVHKWTEFVSYNNGTDIGLNVYQHTAEAVIENDKNSIYDDGTSRVVRTDINGLYEPYSDKLASGYGYGIDFTTHFAQDPLGLAYNRNFTMHTVSGTGQINSISCSNNIVTNYQRGAALLPEYLYKDYYAEIEPVETTSVIGKELLSRYCLTKNKSSINYENEDESEKSRIHFTPVWYPDGKYQIAVFMTDAYTPVGQLWYYRLYDVEIDGSIYDTWYVTRTNNY